MASRRRVLLGWCGAVAVVLGVTVLAEPRAHAQVEESAPTAASAEPTAEASPAGEHGVEAHGEGHPAEAHGEGHPSEAHGEGHGEHVPRFSDINWTYGILGEKKGVQPDLFWRSPGMPVPFVTTLFNWGVFIAILVVLAKKHLPGTLSKRKEGIVRGMREAADMKDDSARRLEEYERKLEGLDEEIERLKEEMRKVGEQERSRILAEAAERRARMERDAKHLIATELENAVAELKRLVAERALATATEKLAGRLTAQDHGRYVEEALTSLRKLPPRSLGGRS